MTKDQEEEKRKLNRSDLRINRGFELMLNKHTRKEELSNPKIFQIHCGKMFSFLSREISIDFHFNIVKK